MEEEKWTLVSDACILIPDYVADVLWEKILENLTHYITPPFDVSQSKYTKTWRTIKNAGRCKTREGLVHGLRLAMNEMGLLDKLVELYENGVIGEDFYDKLPEAIEACYDEISDELVKTHVPLRFYASAEARKEALSKIKPGGKQNE